MGVLMDRAFILAVTAFGLVALISHPAEAASGKCQSIQAKCAVEIGGRCDPKTGRWEYGRNGAGGTNRGGAFDGCVARGMAKRK